MSEKRNTLPQGWEWKKLEDVCLILNGRAYKKEELLDAGKFRVLRVGNFFTNNDWYYSNLDLPEDKYCSNGDLLYAWSASFGPKIWTGEKVIYHYHIWKIIPNEHLILKEFLYILLGWDVEKIKASQGTGTTMMHVTKGSMEARLIPLPPLEEQRRIVGKLDGLFGKIDKSITLLDESIASASSLMPSALNEVFEELGEKWEFEEWKNIVNIKNGKDYKAISNQKGTYPIYGSGGIIGYVDEFLCNENSVIVGRKGTINNPLFVKEKFWNIDTAFGLEAKQEKLKPLYLYYFCLKFDFLQLNTATTLPSLTKSKLQEIQIPLPPLDIQTQTVAYLDALQLKADALKKAQEKKKEELLALKASLLESAFKGAL